MGGLLVYTKSAFIQVVPRLAGKSSDPVERKARRGRLNGNGLDGNRLMFGPAEDGGFAVGHTRKYFLFMTLETFPRGGGVSGCS